MGIKISVMLIVFLLPAFMSGASADIYVENASVTNFSLNIVPVELNSSINNVSFRIFTDDVDDAFAQHLIAAPPGLNSSINNVSFRIFTDDVDDAFAQHLIAVPPGLNSSINKTKPRIFIDSADGLWFWPLINIPSDMILPYSITNLHETGIGITWLNFSWTNPASPDFSYVVLYLNGNFMTNVTAPQNYYNFTGLYPDTMYELGTYTVNKSGQVYKTWINDMARTNKSSVTVPPIAVCGPDKLKCENVGSPVQFNGSASYDPDGSIVSYTWNFGDSTNGTGVAPKHTYLTYRWNGTAYKPYTVNLTVTDNGGLTNMTSAFVTIWITGDSNGDGKVNILDASLIGLKWNTADACADLNNDGKVNIIDASIIGLNWGKVA
jgi:chitodextrinase